MSFVKVKHKFHFQGNYQSKHTFEKSDDGQRNCPKHVVFYSKNKFEKLVHLLGFTIWEEEIIACIAFCR